MTAVTVDQELLEQALEALKQYVPKDDYENKPVGNVMDDLCAALAQEEEAIAQNLQSRLDAALLLEERRQEIAQPRRETEQEPVAWISVTDALPKSGVTVLACYRNRLGKLRRIRAHWIAAKTVEANTDDWDQCSEYDEATDTYYVTEGWYECIDNWGDYSAVAVSEGEVTHWMPLPEAPQEVAA